MPKRRSSVRLKGKTLHANRLAIGEESFVLAFKEKYGRTPKANADVKKMSGADAFKYFSKARITALIEDLGSRKVSRAL